MKHIARVVAAFGLAALLTGCMPRMTVSEMAKHTPERAPETDLLDMFVGEWEFEGTADMAMLTDGPLKAIGRMTSEWDKDRCYLTSRGVYEMEGLGVMHGLEGWNYDPVKKVYRSTWIDSMGSVGVGESKYDAATRTWTSRVTGDGPHGKSSMRGTMTFIDDDNMTFTWTEHMGLTRTMEMSGRSRRVK